MALNVLRGAPGATLAGSASLIDRQMFEFLAAEVIDRLPPGLRRFLLQTAVLPELTASRCAALTGDARAAEHLEAVERAGLFVTSLAEAETTLRLHDLFRDALEHRLQREHSDEVPGLLERAARSEPDGARRLAYWLRAERWDEAARDLHHQSYSLLTSDQALAVQRWLERFPPAARTLPDLELVRTLLAWMYWRWGEMVAASQAAAEGFERAGRPLDALAARAYAVLALRGERRRDESEALAQRVARDVDALLAEREAERRAGQRWDGNEPGMLAAMLGRESASWSAFDDARFEQLAAPMAASIELLDHTTGTAPFFQMLPLPDFVGLKGLREVLLTYVRKARARLGRDDAHLATLVDAIEGSVRVWAGEVEAGEALLREAEADVRWHDFPLRGSLHVYPFLCVAAVLRGDAGALAAAGTTLEATLRRATEMPDIGQRTAGEYAALARLYFLGGLTDDALRVWRLIEPFKPARERPFWAWQRESGAGYIALAAGQLARAEQVFSAALAAHGAGLDLNGQATELALRVAALRLRLGRAPSEAARVLAPAFERHAGDEDIASVWLFGLPGLRELAQAPWGAALPREHIDTLQRWAAGLAALRGVSPSVLPGATAERQAAAPNALSERELEVLERIAAGDSNKLIARAFDLSPHTVKRHVANILDKLALRSRGQAAAWFHEHGGA
jgi:LuxR family maltose regulon positive regulatory protein